MHLDTPSVGVTHTLSVQSILFVIRTINIYTEIFRDGEIDLESNRILNGNKRGVSHCNSYN